MKRLIVIALTYLAFIPDARSAWPDSLTRQLTSIKNDTARVNYQIRVALTLLDKSEYALSKSLAQSALAQSQKLKYSLGAGESHRVMALIHYHENNHEASLKEFMLAKKKFILGRHARSHLQLLREITRMQKERAEFVELKRSFLEMDSLARRKKDTLYMIRALQGLANAHRYLDHYSKSMEYYHSAINLANKAGEKEQEAVAWANLAMVYLYQKKTNEELEAIQKANAIYRQLGDTVTLVMSYINVCNSYLNNDDLKNAKTSCEKAKYLAEEYGLNRIGHILAGEIYRNTGRILAHENRYHESIVNYKMALDYTIASGHKKNIAHAWGELSNAYIRASGWKEAEPGAFHYLNISLEIKHKRGEMKACEMLSRIYANTGNYKKAYDFQTRYTTMKDSLFNVQSTQQMNELHARFESDKKEQEIHSLRKEQLAEKKMADAESHRKSIILYAVSVVLLLLSAFAVYVFRSLKVSNQQKFIIEQKQKEVIDSISYAKRLQQAILVTEDEIRKEIPRYFLFYKPKDIVAGDFYFFETTPRHFFIAAADCTGHGVPGAMVSMVCSNALTRCVKEFGLTDPGQILDKASELITQTFEKSRTDVKDGMDISLLVIPKNTQKIYWAGANNPLWYFQDGRMNEIRPHKQTVGKSESRIPFTTHEITCTTETTLYLFTDGFADQFGGEKGKKYKSSNLKKLLTDIQNKSMILQKTKLENEWMDWTGNREQVDDICIMGIRI